MSNIYIQEPPTGGKVLLKTSVGDIDIELWTKECPKTCRNFIQLCMEGYYNGTIFHRLVKGFIVQGGDPEGTGNGGESIYGEPFKDEFHSRLRYVRRGLVGMANSGKNDNGSQFFFTLAATPELQNQNTLFGKVTGDTVFNMLKLEEGVVDQDERPMYPHKIIKAVILSNPFEDIVPRVAKKEGSEKPKKKKEKGVKNFGLLSFGDEAEEEEKKVEKFIQKNVAGKSKSTHDVLDDPLLSKETVKIGESNQRNRSMTPEIEAKPSKETEETKEKIREKLKRKIEESDEESDDGDDDLLSLMDREKKKEKQKKAEEIRKEIQKLKRESATEKKAKEKEAEEAEKSKNAKKKLMNEYLSEKEKYVIATKKIPKKGASREQHTLEMLAKFQNKLRSLRETKDDQEEEDKPEKAATEATDIDEEINGDSWLVHKLNFETDVPVLAKDASTKGDDWYDAFDPRNPLNKRKRHEKPSGSSSKR